MNEIEERLECYCVGEYAPYLEWLLSLVGGLDWHKKHIRALGRMLMKRFYFVTALDEGIALQAQTLRYDYLNGRWEREVSVLNGDASVLEVLIMLALKIEEDLMRSPSPNEERKAHLYFDLLLQHIGIDEEEDDVDLIDYYVDEFLENGFSGYGTAPDGRRRTLWEQLNAIFACDVRLAGEEDCL